MACLPGMPCFGPLVRVVYPPTCDPFANRIVSSDFVEYNGDNLSCTGIQNCDTLTVALQKIDNKICSDAFVAQIIQTIETNDVLKAYFCQLVSSCAPTTTTTTSSTSSTTTTTTTLAPNGWNTSVGNTAFDACNPIGGQITIYSAGGDAPLADGMIVYSDINLTTPYNASSFISVGVTSFAVSELGVLSQGTLCNSITTTTTSTTAAPTTTTTTTTLNCVYPTLDELATDGFGNMTLTYDLHGSTCSGVFAEYSSDPAFPDPVSGQIIFNGCNLTSYMLYVPSESTLYVRVSTTCGQFSLIGNALSIIPGVPTTTTTTTLPL